MLTKEQYGWLNCHRDTLELFERTDTWIGANAVFDYLEQQGLALEPIIRHCAPCKAGFLKFTLSLLRNYEKTNNTNSNNSITSL